jgi:putative ABC transport system permease protein
MNDHRPGRRPRLALAALAARLFRRDLRSPPCALILLATFVAVAAITAVGSFTDRVRLALDAQSSALLAADLALASTEPLPPSARAVGGELGLELSETLSMRSVVAHGDEMQLVELKAVAPGYPLRGELVVGEARGEPGEPAQGVPPRGEAWVEDRLLERLGLSLGDRVSADEAPAARTRPGGQLLRAGATRDDEFR